MLTHDEVPIVALCTPRGSGALGLLRLSGANALAVASSCARLSSGARLDVCESHTIHHGSVINPTDGTIIDEVMFLVMRGPRTFTGQDTVEITCHNNPFIINQLISVLTYAGARLAEAGEFTKRAFLSGKIDLIQAEAIHDLITAQTEVALRKSLAQLQGSFSHDIAQLEGDLLEILCYAEASFEFLDEEQQDLQFDGRIRAKITTLQTKLAGLLIDHNRQKQIKEGIRVALIGAVNAGKSTLFNALLGKNRSIVSDQAGTTRDSIEATLYRDGTFWLLIDTAGLRQTGDTIEQQGIERSWYEAEQADIILLCTVAGSEQAAEHKEVYDELCDKYKDKIIVVQTKSDMIVDNEASRARCISEVIPSVSVSAQRNAGLDVLNELLTDCIQKLFSRYQSPYLLNERQYNLIEQLNIKIKSIEKNYSDRIQYELLAYHVREMLEMICQLTGKNIHEKMLDKIFSDFCVGK